MTTIQNKPVSTIDHLSAEDVEILRRKTMEHVNRMLVGLAPQTGPGKPNN